jgi:hypothetical protein
MGRFFQGFGGCAGMVISRAIVRDRCHAHTSCSSLFDVNFGDGFSPHSCAFSRKLVVSGLWLAKYFLV